MKKRSIKIALIGTTCTGKTSVFDFLKLKYLSNKEVYFVCEGARSYFQEKSNSVDRSAWEIQSSIYNYVLKNEEIAHLENPKLILCDRSIVDAAVYMEFYGGENKGVELLYQSSDWLKTYDLFLLLDPDGVLYKQDNIRIESLHFRNELHKSFEQFLRKNNINYVLLKGSLSNRIKAVDSIIERAVKVP